MTTENASPAEGCIVANTLSALRIQLRLSDGEPHALRAALASAARIVTEIQIGRGTPAHLDKLSMLTPELASAMPAVAEMLTAALNEQRAEWLRHVTDYVCSAGLCTEARPVPCQAACPANIDIPSILAHIAHGQYNDALSVLLLDTPLPNSCGFVCPAPCEDACVQKNVSSAVVIKPMKSVAARCGGGYTLPDCDPPTGKKVAIVGSGPAGLTAAYYLVQKGHHVEIFDERSEPGGIMRYGIPNYRLPAEVLQAEVDRITALGVTIHTNTPIAKVTDLNERGFDASFLATGLQNSRRLGIPGDDQRFVLGGMDFLRNVRNGKNPRVGPHVIVIGGGNVAIDVAMTAFRQGATKVEIWYRRTRADMPASEHEITMALDEGVQLIEQWTPTRVLPGNLIEFSRTKTAADAATAQPVTVHADQIIAGIGQDADLSYLGNSAIELRWGNIVTDPITLMTAEPGIFSGGDIAHGGSTVVAAIGSAKRAAESIHAYLTGSEMDHAALRPQRRDRVPVVTVGAKARTAPQRPHVPEMAPVIRINSHAPIQYDFCEEVARVEAGRCLRCDLCIGCGLCELACIEVGTEALRMIATKDGRMVFDGFMRPAELCIGCGACAAVCPSGAITVETIGKERLTAITGTVVRRQPLLSCAVCDEPFVTATQYEAMCARLGTDPGVAPVCPSCLRQKASGAAFHVGH